MEVISTNRGERRSVRWKGKQYTTGIFKTPDTKGIFLGSEDVQNDHVHDRIHHGGADKACYLYSLDHYAYWQHKYPELEWNYGMFGENITVGGFNEKQISIGDVFRVGKAVVQVSEPRQPCSNLNLRFQSSKMVKEFVEYGFCGAYLRVLKEGEIRKNDRMTLLEASSVKLNLFEMFRMLYDKNADPLSISVALEHPHLGVACKKNLIKFHKVEN